MSDKNNEKIDSHNRAEERWIFDPRNKKIVQKIKRALRQKAYIRINLDNLEKW